MDIVVNLCTVDVLPPFDIIENELPIPIRTNTLSFANTDCVWMASYDESLKTNPQRRISRQLDQSQTAAFNAWSSSQGLPPQAFNRTKKTLYECYMGRYSIATWRGIALPGAVGWLLNRQRCVSTLPGLERKLRIVLDWALDFVFSNDTSGFLEHDYNPHTRRVVQSVPPLESTRSYKKSHQEDNPADDLIEQQRDGTTG